MEYFLFTNSGFSGIMGKTERRKRGKCYENAKAQQFGAPDGGLFCNMDPGRQGTEGQMA